MRDIKFRAWNKETKTMYYSNDEYTVWAGGKSISVNCKEGQISNSCVGMQYTGLKDKNGKEIYEGDIIEYFQFSRICSKCAHRDKDRNEVKFNSLGATLSSYRILDPQSDISEIEVIGNIHENPKLLETERKENG